MEIQIPKPIRLNQCEHGIAQLRTACVGGYVRVRMCFLTLRLTHKKKKATDAA